MVYVVVIVPTMSQTSEVVARRILNSWVTNETSRSFARSGLRYIMKSMPPRMHTVSAPTTPLQR